MWDLRQGEELRTLSGHLERLSSVAITTNGMFVASDDQAGIIKLWEVATGRELRTLVATPTEFHYQTAIAFTPDGQRLAGTSGQTIALWDVSTGEKLRELTGRSQELEAVILSPDGKTLASRGRYPANTIRVWDLAGNRLLYTLKTDSRLFTAMTFSPDGTVLAAGADDTTIRLWQVATGQELRTFLSQSGVVRSLAFSPDGRMLCVGGDSWLLKFLDVATGNELQSLVGRSPESPVWALAFSSDGKLLASGDRGGTIKLWDVATGVELRAFRQSDPQPGIGVYFVDSLAFSPDGKSLACADGEGMIKLWDVATGRLLRTFAGHDDVVESVVFSPDGKMLASTGEDKSVRLWDVATGRTLHILLGHTNQTNSVAFTNDGKFVLSGGWDGTIKFWKVDSGELLASLIGVDRDDWAVVGPEGRFDASPGAQRLMHWMVGSEPVELEQLKERYYEPRLLAKILGFNHEPLRNISKFENPKLNPEVKYQPLTAGSSTLTVTLTNRGGGIGRVQVFVNGKEFLADARDETLKQNPNVPQATVAIDLAKATGATTGGENNIRVVAWNVENYLSSRGTDLVWTSVGPSDRAPPEVYAIVAGISNYAGSQLNLNFAAKDAVDTANALGLAAGRLFGADKVHLTLLSTADDPRAIAPSKDNFTKVFAAARKAKPGDILIVYLAGHGIALQAGNSVYCYLTSDARSSDSAVLSDPDVRRSTAITSEELTEWINRIPALKQVVVLDTCAAAAAQSQLKLVDKRELSGDAIRALDRARDRTGSYILMGSAADAPSYEASQYGQGLLTYALLKGMNGPALRNDEFVDVSRLFQYARDEVEQLARNIGGIQKPVAFSPRDESFDVGQLTREDRQKIVLASPKPMILRPRFLDSKADDDTLDLMKLLRARLRDESFVTGRGANPAALIFVDDDEFPGGIRPTGRYTVEGNKITLTLRLRRDGVEISSPQTIVGTRDDLPELARKVLAAVKTAIGQLR